MREFRPVIEFHLAGIVSRRIYFAISIAYFSICCARLVFAACVQRDLSESQSAAPRLCSIARCAPSAAGPPSSSSTAAAAARLSLPAGLQQAADTASARSKPRALPAPVAVAAGAAPEEPPLFSPPAAGAATDADESDADLSRLLEALVLSYLFPRFVDRLLDSREQLMQPAYMVHILVLNSTRTATLFSLLLFIGWRSPVALCMCIYCAVALRGHVPPRVLHERAPLTYIPTTAAERRARSDAPGDQPVSVALALALSAAAAAVPVAFAVNCSSANAYAHASASNEGIRRSSSSSSNLSVGC